MDKLRRSRSWRGLAAIALVLVALTVLVGIWVVIRNPLLAVIFASTGALLAAVAWRGLFGNRAGLVWPYVLAEGVLLVAMAYETLSLFRDQRNRQLILVLLVLAATSLGLSDLLRRRYLQERDPVKLPAGARPYLIINPKAGSGRAIKQNIPKLAAAHGIQVLALEPDDNLTDLVRQAVDGGASVLGMSGGDGSLGVAAAAAMQHNIPLVVLPGGTRCHFARDIGLDPENMADALRAFGGREVRIDAAEVNGRVFLNNASFGVYADIVRRPEYREHKVQSTVDVLTGQASLDGYPLSFEDGDGRKRDRAVMVLVGVNKYETLNLTELGIRRRMDEGVLQVTAVYRVEESLLKQLGGAMRLQDRPEGVGQWTTKEFTIQSPSGVLEAGVDGELVKLESPVHLRMWPGCLRLMVPPEGLQKRRSTKTMLANLSKYAIKGKLPAD